MGLSCFKAYDIRGKLGGEVNEEIARSIGCANGEYIKPRRVALGSDLRLTSEPLSSLVSEREAAYPCSGEINYQVADAKAGKMHKVEEHFASLNPVVDRTGGISLEFSDWRFNLCSSNIEPLLPLNVASRNDAALVQIRVLEVEKIIGVNFW